MHPSPLLALSLLPGEDMAFLLEAEGRPQTCWCLVLGLPASRTGRGGFPVIHQLPSYRYLQRHKWIKALPFPGSPVSWEQIPTSVKLRMGR
jgi:hypothetical protein